MVSSARQTITLVVLLLCAVVCIQAQTTSEKVATGSISGKVTIKGKPAVGVAVAATDTSYGHAPNKSHRTTTDQVGNYRIPNLPAATYQISPITPSLVPTEESNSVVVADGEEVENINFTLVPGGVITGKITDADGRPVIAEHVSIMPVHDRPSNAYNRTMMMRMHLDNNTDDRGVYRIFGLPPGKYKVSVGRSGSGMERSREYYKQTFHPSVTDAAKATAIEVTEGSETKDIDIVLGRSVKAFSVAGRVIDGETGRPVPNIEYGVGQRFEHEHGSSSSSSRSGDKTNANGEFRFENATLGRYTIFTVPREGSDIPSASVTFDVIDRDVTDLVIKTTKGSSLSGVVVLDGNEIAPAAFSRLRVCVSMESRESGFANSSSSAVGQDGAFSINGVRSGPVSFWLCGASDNRQHFQIVRVERNGVPQPETISVKEREHVAGIRVVVKYLKLTGTIRGQVKAENGELPPVSDLSLMLWPLDENLQPKRTSSIPTPQLDARGRFVSEGLPAGAYQITVYLYTSPAGRTRTFVTTTQQVTVIDDTVTEVTLIVKPQSNPN